VPERSDPSNPSPRARAARPARRAHERRLARAGALVALVSTAVLTAGARSTTPVHAAPGREPTAWVAPVRGEVVAAFDPPAGPFAPGHRGIDVAVPPGTAVRAAAPGVVVFAGSVAGARHVVVDHGGGLRTGYSFLARTTVSTGDAVDAGAVLGHTGASAPGAPHHHGGVLHLSLRAGDAYLDPSVLLGPVDLTEVVRLVPHTRPRAAGTDHHDDLVEGEYDLQRSDHLPEWLRNEEWIAEQRHARRSLFGRARDAVGGGARWLARQGRRGLDALAGVEERVLPVSPLSTSLELADAAARWARGDCTDATVPVDRPVNYHDGLFVAGINSATGPDGSTAPFPLADLYADGMAHWFEYPSGPEPGYAPADTHGPLLDAAAALRDQLIALRRAGAMEVDLIAHSQGGVVVQAFLTHFYDDARDELPLVTTVVAIASPLEGAPLAGAAGDVAAGPLRRIVESAGGIPLDAPALRDLAPGSAVVDAARRRGLPDGVEVLSIGVATDPVVPATATDGVPGVRSTVEWVSGRSPHGDALTDRGVVEATAVGLAGLGVPCAGLAEHLLGAGAGSLVEGAQRSVGRALR
jgi:murein DD-endopeptidase MepM/ murein hydrolase activator NlpD